MAFTVGVPKETAAREQRVALVPAVATKLIALGATVREAFEIMYYLDAACQIQIDACAGGLHNVQIMSDAAAQKSYDRLSMADHPREHRDWPALLRLLDRKNITYKD